MALAAGGVALSQKWKAEEQTRLAVAQRQEAELQREEADRQRAEAERQREEAENQFRRAEEERLASTAARLEASEQRGVAEEQARLAAEKDRLAREKELEALAQREAATRSQEEAAEAQRMAEAARLRAEQEEKEAEAALAQAAEASAESERLRLLDKAEAVAVLTTSMTDPSRREESALLAVAAYRLTQRHDGDAWSSQGHDALRLAYQRLSPERGSLLRTHRAEIRSLIVVDDGAGLAFGDERGDLQILDLRTPWEEPREIGSFRGGVRALAWRPKVRWLVAGGKNGAVRLWDLDKPEDDKVLRSTGPTVQSLVFFPGGRKLAAGDAEGGVRIFEVGPNAPQDLALPRSDAGDAQVSALTVHPNGNVLAAADRGQGIVLWSLSQLDAPPRVLDHDVDVSSVDFSPDGLFLAAGSGSGTLWLFSLDTDGMPRGEEPQALFGHRRRIVDLKFHPRRNVLASAGLDGDLRLWDVGRGDLPSLVLASQGSPVRATAFTQDGKLLISSNEDRSVHLWTTSSEPIAQAICDLVERDLTPKEWGEHLGDFPYETTCPESG